MEPAPWTGANMSAELDRRFAPANYSEYYKVWMEPTACYMTRAEAEAIAKRDGKTHIWEDCGCTYQLIAIT